MAGLAISGRLLYIGVRAQSELVEEPIARDDSLLT